MDMMNNDFNKNSEPKENIAHPQPSSNDQERVLITGDDILIEYVDRLMREIQDIDDSDLKPSWIASIEKFITHYVWHSQDVIKTEKIKQGQRY